MNGIDLDTRLLDCDARLQVTNRLVNTHGCHRRDGLWRGIHPQQPIGTRLDGVEIHDHAERLQLWVVAFGEDRRNRCRPSINTDGTTDYGRIALKQFSEDAAGNRELR